MQTSRANQSLSVSVAAFFLAFLAATTMVAQGALADQAMVRPKAQRRSHMQVVSSVANIVSDQRAQGLARARGLNFVNVMWEDTGRFQGSSVGPNISDVTIEVEAEEGRNKRRFLMPVMRYPNFADKTGDVDIDLFRLRVGNQKKSGKLRTVTLRQFLKHPGRYASLPRVGTIKGGSLLAKRDSKVLTSAQAAFLPVPLGGKARFYPVIFNYQSYAKNPAVLTLLVTRQGTSMTIVDNNRDTVGDGSWGQRLYFNAGGKRAPLTAERLNDVTAKGVTSNGEIASTLGKDSNLLMIVQVPLKVKRQRIAYDMDKAEGAAAPINMPTSKSVARGERGSSDVDVAVLGHGATKGPYTELDGLTIERDSRFPVRVTVQFYQATSNGVVSAADVKRLNAQIEKVYSRADYVGSLVVPTRKDRKRKTNWTGVTEAPRTLYWTDFPGLVERFAGFVGISYSDGRFVW